MSIEAMAEVWKKSQHSGSNLLMLLSVADFADDDGVAFPSVQRLADKCRMTKRNAQDRLRELAESGELSIFKNQGPPPKFPNLFQVNLNALGVKPTSPVQPTAPVQSDVSRGEVQRMEGVKPTSPKPSLTINEPPNRAQDKPAVSRTRKKKQGQTFSDWYTQVTEAGEKAISNYTPVLTFAEQVGLPLDWIDLGWQQFKRDHIARTDKQQADWRLTFLNYCRKGWLNVWKARRDGTFYLSDAGVMLAKELGVDVPNESQAQTTSLLAGCI